MELVAISKGYGLPATGTTGLVHSVFERAINLSSVEKNGLLTTITSEEVDLPQGIRVITPTGFSFETIMVGEAFQFSNNACHVGQLTIRLETARVWRCDLPSLNLDLNHPQAISAWKTVWIDLNHRQEAAKATLQAKDLFNTRVSTEPGLSPKLIMAIRKLVDATQNLDLELATTASTSLIGLGVGLTPSGDDFLVGFLAGLWCQLNREKDFSSFREQLGKRIIQKAQATNAISRTFLHYAAQGQVSSHLEGLTREISSPTSQQTLSKKSDLAMLVGASSGMDGVTGLLIGLGCIEKPWER